MHTLHSKGLPLINENATSPIAISSIIDYNGGGDGGSDILGSSRPSISFADDNNKTIVKESKKIQLKNYVNDMKKVQRNLQIVYNNCDDNGAKNMVNNDMDDVAGDDDNNEVYNVVKKHRVKGKKPDYVESLVKCRYVNTNKK